MTYDITLFGATGFTGGLTAEYLSANLPSTAQWAVAGRNATKLEELVERLTTAGGNVPSIVLADISRAPSIRAMAENTRVLMSAVGPYLHYGEPVVKAAVDAGIDYVDLTGEPQFVDEMWLKYHETAVANGARIVHACGFDSIPYDLGALFTVRQLPSDQPISIAGYIRAKASFSGGTYGSALNQMNSLGGAQRSAKKRKSLEKRPANRKISGGGKLGAAPSPLPGWGAPLPTIDPQIVLRSARALDCYGPDFHYEHYAHFYTRRMLVAAVPALAGIAAGSQLAPVRALLGKMRSPGEGPSEEQRAQSWFELSLIAESGDKRLLTTVTGGDPGYTETSKMLAESAMCLAFDQLPSTAGQLTTAEAMGVALITRLQNAGIDFQTRDISAGGSSTSAK